MNDADELAHAVREQIPAVLRALAGSTVEELTMRRAGRRLTVRRAVPDATVSIPTEPSASLAELSKLAVPGRTEVRAQVVGVFHRSREADGPALAQAGDLVDGNRAIGVIETLGITSDVVAPLAGRLIELVAHDGQAVGYGTPIAVIAPE
ncbi:MAG: acetyl-CoA carboxylase biotin carboxyl carrier protein [Chloroflexota bacterium]